MRVYQLRHYEVMMPEENSKEAQHLLYYERLCYDLLTAHAISFSHAVEVVPVSGCRENAGRQVTGCKRRKISGCKLWRLVCCRMERLKGEVEDAFRPGGWQPETGKLLNSYKQ